MHIVQCPLQHYNNEDMESTLMSTDREMDKEGIYMRYYSTIRKNEIMLFVASWVDLEISTLNEVKERQIPY